MTIEDLKPSELSTLKLIWNTQEKAQPPLRPKALKKLEQLKLVVVNPRNGTATVTRRGAGLLAAGAIAAVLRVNHYIPHDAFFCWHDVMDWACRAACHLQEIASAAGPRV